MYNFSALYYISFEFFCEWTLNHKINYHQNFEFTLNRIVTNPETAKFNTRRNFSRGSSGEFVQISQENFMRKFHQEISQEFANLNPAKISAYIGMLYNVFVQVATLRSR